MSQPDLRDLQAFIAVARHRNFRRAAAEQQVSASSLSQRLRDLEERLGARLLHRTTRSVSLTEAGERLLDRTIPALAEVTEALDELRGLREGAAGRLRINAPPPAIDSVLAPMIAPFLKRYPNIELELVAEAVRVDIVAGGFDAGVRYEEHLAQDMIAVPLGPPQCYSLVAAPSVIETYGVPKEPANLVGLPCVVHRFDNGNVLPWEFEKNGRTVRIAPTGQFRSNNLAALLQATLDGLGFFLSFEDWVRADIEAGRLVPVLKDWCEEFPGPLLYYPSRRQPPPALRAFVDFVREWRASRIS
jgi:DNA-binding transcriptional LysR family regulator